MSEVSRASLVLVSFLGAGQALVLAIALVFRAVNRPANRVLAALLVAMAVYLGNGAYQAADLVARWPVFFRWAHPVPLLFGPLLFLYARLVTDERRRLRWRDALHLVPAVAVVLWSLPVYLLPGAEKAALFATMREGVVPALVATNLRVTLWLKLASGVTYTALTVHATLRHRRRIRAEYSTLDRISLDWLLLLVAASVLVWAIAVATQFVEPSGVVSPGTGDQLIALLMTLAVCTIGVRGMQQAPVRLVTDEDRTRTSTDVGVPAAVERSVHDDAPDTTTTPEQPAKTGRSDRSSITPGMSRALEHRLHAEMRDAESWRRPELTLAELAARIGTTPHKLSEVLNLHIRRSFHDYVNGFRVREVQHRLAQPDADQRTLLAIALDAGFASKSTFNSVFRREVGMTPSEWRDREATRRHAAAIGDVQSDPSGRPAR